MIFSVHLKTPANTPASAPLITRIPIVTGTITHMHVFFPPGCNALAHLKLRWGLYQLFPSNEQGDFASGGILIDWAEDIEIDMAPLELDAYTWNEDTLYDHTITVDIVITPASSTRNAQSVIQQVLAAQQPGIS